MPKSKPSSLRASSRESSSSGKKKTPSPSDQPRGAIASIREWGDALVIAYLLAMFIRMFVFELFKIPSSSMTPTLLGTEQPRHGYRDVNGDGEEDMILRSMYRGGYDVYLNNGDRFQYAGVQNPIGRKERDAWESQLKIRQDRIIVCKFLYWFSPPKRGDIVVFKVPECIYQSEKPIYIKRVAGLPGETLTFEPAKGVPGHDGAMGHLVADGKRVESPDFFKDQLYEFRNIGGVNYNDRPSYTRYHPRGSSVEILEMKVPENSVFVFGDNTVSSTDSRYWGKVDLSRLRGRAVFRYNPGYFPFTKTPGFLK